MNATPRAPSTALIRVLLIDDADDDRLVADLLDSVPTSRFLIARASTLAEGRDRLDHDRFDVCLLGLCLADGDGLDFLASAQARGLMLPFIILSDSTPIEQDYRAMTLGAVAFLDRNELAPRALERAVRYAVHQRMIIEGLVSRTFRDDATGLIAGALYRDRLERAIAFARRRDREVAVMMIDLAFDPDDETGDRLTDTALAGAGSRLAGALRETDTVARLADRRLGLLIEGMRSLDHAAMVARKAVRLLRRPIDVDARAITIVPSIGIAVYPREGDDGAVLLRHAETAMRRASSEGGGCRFGSERVDYEVREGMVLERAFSTAFERRELRLRFHPEVHFTGGRTGLAGEIFWRHPDKGWLPLDASLTQADDETMIKGIADWTLAAAAEQLLAWERGGLKRPCLSLPFPFRRRPALALLARAVAEQVEPRGVDPDRIELDLMEDLVLSDARRGFSRLTALKAIGVRLALDGFGQGRTAIPDLRSDLLSSLKLAPDLHRDLPGDARRETLLRALVNLGHDLDLEVTAKGAGDPQKVALLKRLGCDAVQLSAPIPPMSADAAAGWLRTLAPDPAAGNPQRSSPPEIFVPEKPPLRRTEDRPSVSPD